MYTSAYSPGFEVPNNYNTEVEDDCCPDSKVSSIALTILAVGLIIVASSLLFTPVLLIPGAIVAVGGGGIYLFSFGAPRHFITSLPSYFPSGSGYSSGYNSGFSSYGASNTNYAASSYGRPARATGYSAAPAYTTGPDSAFVPTGGHSGVGVFRKR